MKTRYLHNQVVKDLNKKMVFLCGPRQVGKTYFSKQLQDGKKGYLNWDNDRDRILSKEFPESALWVFDEIHKYKGWRNFIKGVFDVKKSSQKILVTGSARLDVYSRGGDSLQGRYHLLRLHPLSYRELGGINRDDLLDLFKLNGFPEPFFSSSKTETDRWSIEYRKRLIREEVRSLEKIEDLVKMEIMLKMLFDRVGSPLSVNSLREDLNIAHETAAKWLNVLENLYGIFRISPFGHKFGRAVKKERKHYHFDWNLVQDEGDRFENMIACHLKKWIHYQEDCFGKELELRFFRDTENREIDFVICEGIKPLSIIECKLRNESVSPVMRSFLRKHQETEAYQISLHGTKDYVTPEGIRVLPAHQYLGSLV